jgi:hypothetical protein
MPEPLEVDPQVQQAVDQFQAEALQFSFRFINDAKVRAQYKQMIEATSREIIADYQRGSVTPAEAARRANMLRNEILKLARTKTSDVGLAIAKDIKAEGPPLQYFCEKYARDLYKKAFSALSEAERNAVFLKIVERSGVADAKMVAIASGAGKVGRGLIVLSVAVSIWNVWRADDKLDAAGKEAAATGGGILGGMAAGAAVGVLGGPAAPITVPLAAFVGGVLGALGGEHLYDRYAHGHW